MAQKYRRLIPILSWTLIFALGLLVWSIIVLYGYPLVVFPIYSYLSTHVPIEWVFLFVVIAIILIDPIRKWRK